MLDIYFQCRTHWTFFFWKVGPEKKIHKTTVYPFHDKLNKSDYCI